MLVRLEEADSNSRALVAAVGPEGDGGGGKGKRRRGKAPGAAEPQEPEVAATDRASMVCFSMRDTGTCKWGDSCGFAHDEKTLKEARRAAKGADPKGSKGRSKGETAKGGRGGRGGGKQSGDPKGGKGDGKSQQPRAGKGTCLNFLRGRCNKSAQECGHSHDVRAAQKIVNAVWAGTSPPQTSAQAPEAAPVMQ